MLNRINGHKKGTDVVREIVRTCLEIGVPTLTLYAFSTENWQRPKIEVAALMAILKRFLISEREEIIKNNIRLNAIGQTERLPDDVQKALYDTMGLSRKNTGLLLNLALSYGGRAEIVKAVHAIAKKVKAGDIDPDAIPNPITEELVADNLFTRGIPDPDLLIRTSGEMRLSNFFLWQISYSEIFITDTLWPDFSKDEFIRIIKNYQCRERRFGKV